MKTSYSLRSLVIAIALFCAAFVAVPECYDWMRWKTMTGDEICKIRHDDFRGDFSVSVSTLEDGECRDFKWISMLRALSTRASHLVSLDLDECASCRTQIGDDAMAEIASFHELKELRIAFRTSATQYVSLSSFVRLRNLSKLRQLTLYRARELNADRVRCLGTFPSLTQLSLPGCRFARGAVQELTNCRRLECLDCSDCDLDDSDLMILAQISSLRKFVVACDSRHHAKITDAGVSRLQAHRPDLEIHINSAGNEGRGHTSSCCEPSWWLD